MKTFILMLCLFVCCPAYAMIDGVCASNGMTMNGSTITVHDVDTLLGCTAGSVANATLNGDDSQVVWQCLGVDGGKTAICSMLFSPPLGSQQDSSTGDYLIVTPDTTEGMGTGNAMGTFEPGSTNRPGGTGENNPNGTPIWEGPSDSNDPAFGDFGGRFGKFMNDISQTPLFSLPSQFLQAIPPSGEATLITFSTDYGEFNYDFAQWPSIVFTTLKAVMIITFGFVAVRIVCLKR